MLQAPSGTSVSMGGRGVAEVGAAQQVAADPRSHQGRHGTGLERQAEAIAGPAMAGTQIVEVGRVDLHHGRSTGSSQRIVPQGIEAWRPLHQSEVPGHGGGNRAASLHHRGRVPPRPTTTMWCASGRARDLGHFVAPFFMTGARHNDRMLYVVEDPDHRRLTRTRGTGKLVRTGVLEIADVDAVYAPSLDFDPDAQLGFSQTCSPKRWRPATRVRASRPTAPPCLAGTTAMRWLAWEHLADAFEAAMPVIGVCCFDWCHIAPEMVADLGGLHPDPPTRRSLPSRSSTTTVWCGVTGSLDNPSAAQLWRIHAARPNGAEIVVGPRRGRVRRPSRARRVGRRGTVRAAGHDPPCRLDAQKAPRALMRPRAPDVPPPRGGE